MADCVRCARPVADTGYACHGCATGLAVTLLRAAMISREPDTTIARLDRIARVGGTRAKPTSVDGWHKGDGALPATPLPVNLDAAADLAAVRNTLTTWSRHIANERGTRLPGRWVLPERPPGFVGPLRAWAVTDTLQAMLCWLAGQAGWIRLREEAAEILDELHDAASLLRRIIDRPAGRVLAGVCDCGEYLYAIGDKPHVTCRACERTWDVEQMRAHLRSLVDGQVFTAAEIATLAVHLGISANRQRVRHLVNVWASRGVVVAHGVYDGNPAYLFGEVMPRLATVLVRAA